MSNLKDTVQFLLIIGLMVYIIFLKQCAPSQPQPYEAKLDTIIRMDTILPPPVIVQLPKQHIPTPTVLYIDSSKNIVSTPIKDSSQYQVAQSYQDSLEDENLTLYYNSVVQGQLLQNDLRYKLKIPKQITKTIEIPKPIPTPQNLLLFNVGAGTDTRSFSTLSVGLQFVSKKGWSAAYDYDIFQNSHQVRLGVPIWRQKSNK